MATTDQAIGDALAGLEALRPGVAILAHLDPLTGGIINTALSLAYEGLVALRQAILTASEEDMRLMLAKKAERTIQELAALKFGAMP